MAYTHTTVLLQSAVAALLNLEISDAGLIAPNQLREGVYVDGTFGRGGHSRCMLNHLTANSKLVVFDKDPQAIQIANDLASHDPRVLVVHDGFSSLTEHLENLGLGSVDGVLLDLGVSSPQIDDAQRGFSFMRNGPLDMRMDTSRGLTAQQWLADADQDEIKEVIANYGEERYAFQIAKEIVARRQSKPLHSTSELAELVASVVRSREKGQHPATRTFQAIRIYINQELKELADVLPSALVNLSVGGRLVVISFHSLEDRMVKQCFAAAATPGKALARMPILERDMPKPYVNLVGKYKAKDNEVDANVRSRSAIMRVAERTLVDLTMDEASSFIRLPGEKKTKHKSNRIASKRNVSSSAYSYKHRGG